MDYGMILKDASAYNIQFRQGKPILIDTLSFEIYQEGRPWVAYRQFCQHFLAPLVLMAHTDIRLSQFSRIYIDGISLDLASKLLPKRTWVNFGLLSHIHLHAKSQKRFAATTTSPFSKGGTRGILPSPVSTISKVSKTALLGIIDNLETATRKLNWKPAGTEWGDYYEDTNYSSEALNDKKKAICKYLDEIKPKTLWDMGANTGLFSRLASDKGIQTISFDIDPAAVEKNYRMVQGGKKKGALPLDQQAGLLPLCLDLTNPSPAIGWANEERHSLLERGPVDAIMALALVHHLAISNNLPFPQIAQFFSTLCQYLIIEYVPKTDSQVQRMLSIRGDFFSDYTQVYFEATFSDRFSILKRENIIDTKRTLYLMENKNDS